MNTSVIRQRVADFLQRHAPFDTLPEPDLLALAGSGKVKFHESEEFIFQKGERRIPFVWVIQQGRVELLDDSERLLDVLGEGDILGLDRFSGDGACIAGSRTASDVILYGVESVLFESMAARHAALRRFLEARYSVSGTAVPQRTSWLDAAPPPLEFLRARLAAVPRDAPPRQIAARLVKARNGVVAMVDEAGRMTGTLTPREWCAGPTPGPCPPIAAAPLTTRAAVRAMLHSGRDQVAITADGTPASPLEALLTAADLALFCGHDPMRLIAAMESAPEEEIAPLLGQLHRLLREGLAQPHDVDDCCRIGAEVVATVTRACIRLAAARVAEAGFATPLVASCWVLFGASARNDLLAPELPRIAVIYDDTAASFRPADTLYFTAVAGDTTARFDALGLTGPGLNWPSGAGTSMPLSEWKRLYSETVRQPAERDLYGRRSFFDMASVAGDASILRRLQDHLALELARGRLAVSLLANDTLAQLPPLTLFHGLVLELDGGQSDSFEIDETVVTPLANAARVFSIAKGRLVPVNTLRRLEAAALDFPAAESILHDAAEAFRVGLYYQWLAGGNRIEPAKLTRLDQLLLKNAFASIRKFLEFTAETFVPSL